MVELIVPEEPQATRTVQRKFLNQHKAERKGRCEAWMEDFNDNMLNLIIIMQILPLTCLSVTLSMSGFHKGQDDI